MASVLTLAQREVRSRWFIWWRGSIQTASLMSEGILQGTVGERVCAWKMWGSIFLLKILASMSEVIGGSPSVCGAQGCSRALASVCLGMVPQRC